MELFEQSEFPYLPFELPADMDAAVDWDGCKRGFRIDLPNGQLFYAPQFFDPAFSDRSLDYLLDNETLDWRKANWRDYQHQSLETVNFRHINWRHEQVRVYGKYHYQPRYTAWHGDADAAYSYSGIDLKPQPWNDCLVAIRDRIRAIEKTRFNAVLLNWYRDGDDAMGWHADNEAELGPQPVIASVSFGATRDFQLRSNDRRWKLSIPLTHGSLLMMLGPLQQHWQHALPKRRRVTEPRLNLTFRRVYPAGI